MKNKTIAIVGAIIVVVASFVISSSLYKKSQEERLGFLAQENAKLFAPDYAPVYGDPNAKVVLTEFLDPECESCRMFYPKVKELLKMYEGRLKLVVRYAAFHRNSVHAIRVLEATRKQNKYWESLDIMFRYQPAWADHHNPQPQLVFQYLPEVGVDVDKLKKDMDDPEIVKIIEQDAKDLKALNVRGTPTFFVNGKPLQSFSVGSLYNLVDTEVKAFYSK